MKNFKQGIVVVGGQWGDEGKGRIVDSISEHCDIVVRFHGGNNAGHSLHYDNKSIVLHLIPCGIVRENKLSLIGNGVVIDPDVLLQEIDTLKNMGLEVTNEKLKISYDANIIFPFHRQIDSHREENKEHFIGTTKRGIGPCYETKVSRTGIRAKDLICHDVLYSKLNHLSKIYSFELEAAYLTAKNWAKFIEPFLAPVGEILEAQFKQNKRILFEGAQGALLDVDHGTYPYVTSSNCVSAQASIGSGIGPSFLEEIFLVSKAYCTRVGEGPFPTEASKEEQERIREIGHEYGATTKRPRRCGWLDLPALKYAARINGATGVILTKIDVLCEITPIKICVGYKNNFGEKISFDEVLRNIEAKKQVYPQYEFIDKIEHFNDSIRNYNDLNDGAKKIISLVEDEIKLPIRLLTYGKERGKEIWF